MTDAEAQKSYNVTPYPSFPFSYTHPTHLFTVAKLFGLKPKPVEKARVLEIGCSSGGNLIPMAFHYPTAEFLGIDFSQTEIDLGIKQTLDLNLKNITLRHQNIKDYNNQDGKFDYIICHGIYSWVSPEIRTKILQICHENLTKNGVAYVSYNTFPGWNMANSVKDLMIWHTKNISDPTTKAQQARAVIKFIADGLQNENSAYAMFLRNEINILGRHSDSYLLHEHLSPYNQPTYFYEFMEHANAQNLAYLSDTFLAMMYTDNLPPIFANELKKMNNIVYIGQYMDFIRNQRFRCTLLCHQDAEINRNLKTSDIEEFYLQLTAKMENENFTEANIGQDQELVFSNPVLSVKVKEPNSQQALMILQEGKAKPISYNQLCEDLIAKGSVTNIDEAKKVLNDELNLMRWVLAGLVQINAYSGDYITQITDKPTACPLVRYQAERQNFVTNRRHQVIALDPLSKEILPLLDGTKSLQDLEALVAEKVKAGKLSIVDKEKAPITEPAEIENQIKSHCEQILQSMASQALLIA